jgi:hypothetical protein
MQNNETVDLLSHALWRRGELMEVAKGKPTSQSSLSEWSTPGESAKAVSGSFPEDFAFHTDYEENPWWQVDLTRSFPLQSIVLHNRIGALQERAKNVRVEVSSDQQTWQLIHAGFVIFGGGPKSSPFEMMLGGQISARYVRISLPETEHLHLSQVQVFTRPDGAAIDDFRNANGLVNLRLKTEDPSKEYRVAYEPNTIHKDRIVGLKISYSSRFGNLFQQYTHAILLAKRTGLKFIQLGSHSLFNVTEAVTIDGITFIPQNAPMPLEGAFLSGIFFDSNDFQPVLSPFLTFTEQDEIEHAEIARTFFRNHLLTGLNFGPKDQPESELTIHIRSGDIFDDSLGPVNTWYRQPPLSFYTLVVDRLLKQGAIDRVKVVYEDRGNPCVDLLEQWLADKGVPTRMQSISLAEDLSALIDAPHLAFGHGTFGYAACRLSLGIKTLHYFEPELGGRYAYIPGIDHVYSVYDARGDYMKAGVWGQTEEFADWRNTPEQRAMMGTFPETALALKEV